MIGFNLPATKHVPEALIEIVNFQEKLYRLGPVTQNKIIKVMSDVSGVEQEHVKAILTAIPKANKE